MGTDWLRSLNFMQLNNCNRLQNDYCSSTHVRDCLPGDWTGVSLVVSCHGRVLDQWLQSPAANLWCPSLRLADWSQTVVHHPWACRIIIMIIVNMQGVPINPIEYISSNTHLWGTNIAAAWLTFLSTLFPCCWTEPRPYLLCQSVYFFRESEILIWFLLVNNHIKKKEWTDTRHTALYR